MPEVQFVPFFPAGTTPAQARALIEAEMAAIPEPRRRKNGVYLRVMRDGVAGYLAQASAARSAAAQWRCIAEAMYWLSVSHSADMAGVMARIALDARHASARTDRETVLERWASGRYSSRNACAAAMAKELGRPCATVRGWLTGAPQPVRRPRR